MTKEKAIEQLEKMGTAQNRKVYRRHGVGANQYGVSYASLGKLKKTIKTDHELARQLWKTGNHDARVLATMIADPARADDKLLDSWARDLDNYVLTDAFSGYASQTNLARSKMKQWIEEDNEWKETAGWNLLAVQTRSKNGPSNEDYESYLDRIEQKIHRAKNRVRYSMNTALISIALVDKGLKQKAQAAAKRIGPVEVDHGETGCKTPDADPYIEKAWARRR